MRQQAKQQDAIGRALPSIQSTCNPFQGYVSAHINRLGNIHLRVIILRQLSKTCRSTISSFALKNRGYAAETAEMLCWDALLRPKFQAIFCWNKISYVHAGRNNATCHDIFWVYRQQECVMLRSSLSDFLYLKDNKHHGPVFTVLLRNTISPIGQRSDAGPSVEAWRQKLSFSASTK